MKEQCLFMGGCADGHRKAVDPVQWIQVPVQRKAHAFHEAGPLPEYEPLDIQTYQPMRLHGDGEMFTVFVLKGLTGADVMKLLIKHYRP